MVNVDDAVISRLSRNGETFEILVDCEQALELKQGKIVSMADVLASDKIFSDSKKGMLVSENKLKQVFHTEDHEEIAKIIIKEGEVQLTSSYREKLRKQRRNRILEYIHRNGIDPKTKLPHPLTRIELAFEEAKIKIDDAKSEQEQIKEIVKKLKIILPISFESIIAQIKIPSKYSGRGYSIVQKYTHIREDKWESDGSWYGKVEIESGNRERLMDELNNVSHGEVEINIIK